MMLERAAVVDDENRFLRWATRDAIHRDQLPHRSIHVMLYDRAGRLVLQKRSVDKQTYPGCWDLSASGHVEEPDYPNRASPDDGLDAVYDAVAHRELEEELGVRCPLTRLGVFGPEKGVHYEHLVLYRGVSDGPYVPQPTEVECVEAFTREALWALLDGDVPQTRSLGWLVRWARDHGVLGPAQTP